MSFADAIVALVLWEPRHGHCCRHSRLHTVLRVVLRVSYLATGLTAQGRRALVGGSWVLLADILAVLTTGRVDQVVDGAPPNNGRERLLVVRRAIVSLCRLPLIR